MTSALAAFLAFAPSFAPSLALSAPQSTDDRAGTTSLKAEGAVSASAPAIEAELRRERTTPPPAFATPDQGEALGVLPAPSVAASAFATPGDLNALAVGLSQESYLSRQAPEGKSDGYQLISARLRTRARTGNPFFSSYLELGGAFAANVENASYVAVPEAYLRWASEPAPSHEPTSGFTGRAKAPGFSLLVGRAKERWSRVDEQWGLGLWQPLFRWDWIRPEQQGLAGAFLAMENEDARLVLFGTPIFLPEQGPPFELIDGKFNSPSPWFVGPPDAALLFSRRDDIRYTLKTPPVGSIINHGAAGAMVQLGNPARDGFFAQGSYAYKPRNQLATPFEAFLGNAGPTATVYPDVAYHHLIGLDVGARRGRVSAWISGLREAPLNPDFGSLTYQRLSAMTAISPTFEAALPFAEGWRPRLILSYLRREGGEGTDVNALPSQTGAAFGARFPYANAGSVAMRATTQIAHGRLLDFGLKATQEFAEGGSILSADARFQPAPAWTLILGADLISSSRPENDASTLIARHRGNDRAFLGAAYAF